MPTITNEKPFPKGDFSGGIQRKTTKFLRRNNECDLAVNAVFGRIGGVEKIPGMEKLGGATGSSGVSLNLHGYNKSDGTADKLIINEAGTFKIYNSTTGVWDSVGGVSLTANLQVSSTNFLNHAFFVNGTDSNYSYSGSAWSTTTNLTDSPIAKFIENHTLRVYLGSVTLRGTVYRSRVWYSDLPKNNSIIWDLETGTDLVQSAGSAVVTSAGSLFLTRGIKTGDPIIIEDGSNAGQYTVRSVDLETQLTLTEALTNAQTGKSFWVGGNWFDVVTDDSDYLTGFGKNSSELLIFKRNSLHKCPISNSNPSGVKPVKAAPGTTSGRSVVNMNEYTYYFAPKIGIMRYDGIQSTILSNAIEDLIDGVASDMYTEVVGWSVNNKLIKFYLGTVTLRTGDTITNCVTVWDTITETWSTQSLPYEIEQATKWFNSSGIPDSYVSTTEYSVLKDNTGTAYDTYDISFQLEDGIIFPEGEDVLVDFQRVRFFINNGPDMQIMYKLYYKPTKDPFRWDIDGDWKPLRGKADGEKTEFFFNPNKERRACGVQFKFIQSSKYESFLIEKYIIYGSNPSVK